MKKLVCLLPLLLLAVVYSPVRAQEKPAEKWPETSSKAKAPDKQPEKGPGSSEYAHKSVEIHEALEAGERYWLYTPAEPKPAKAPVIVFFHGYNALLPEAYDAWLNHLCRRGNIVIYPQYQAHGLDPSDNWLPNTAASLNDAFAYLEADKTLVQPDKAKFAVAGHSAGGVMAANYAADWAKHELPKPVAAMPIQPGRAFSYNNRAQNHGLIPLADFANIPEDCLFLPVFSDSDTTVGSWCAMHFFAAATKVKTANKNLVRVNSCDYTGKGLVAHHQTPAAPSTRDEMLDLWDWFGYWKLLDGLTDAAFHGKNREYALGDTAQQRSMGNYSDGRPVCRKTVWLGDAEVDPDAEEYIPAFNRDGTRNPAFKRSQPEAEPKQPESPKTPGRKEDEAEEEEF